MVYLNSIQGKIFMCTVNIRLQKMSGDNIDEKFVVIILIKKQFM